MEIDYQMMIFSSLDLIEYREIQKKNKIGADDDYLGLLMPFYDYEYDIGSYGFLSNNGYKILSLKKIDDSIKETSSAIKLKEIFLDIQSKLVKTLLNPFYDKNDFYSNNESKEREKFKSDIFELLRIKQIYN